jgi:PAS domain S-box-containing protein
MMSSIASTTDAQATRADDSVVADLYRGIIQALPAHLAVVDPEGRLILVNEAWRDFSASNGGPTDSSVMVGANYLEVCRAAVDADIHAAQALAGIEAVLAGELPQFTLEYPCHSAWEQRWFLMTVSPLALGNGTGAVIAHVNISIGKEAEQALRASEIRFRAMFENAAVGIAEIAPDGRWLRVNDRLKRIIGYSIEDLLATTYRGITHPDDVDADATQLEVMRSGAADSCCVEKRFLRKDGSAVWVAVTLSSVRTASGAVAYFVAVIEDITERKQADERQRTLLQELAHRGKNLLAVVQSIANRSLSGDQTLAESREAFNGRLQSLAQTYGALTHEAFEGALLEGLLRNELAAFGGRVRLSGPQLMLTVKAAQTFALVAHELATKAAKYGALSVPAGHLRVTWQIGGPPAEPRLIFDWIEEGGPPAEPPTRRGFGTTLVSTVAGSDFGCKPELMYRPDGFRYRLDAPLSRLGSVQIESPVRRRLKSAAICSLYDAWAQRRDSTGFLPQLTGFDWSRFAATGALTVAVVEAGGSSVRFVQVGRALVNELGRPLRDKDMAAEDEVGLAEAYRRCARQGEPTHELLRFDFGDGDPVTFERLLVPFSATGGRSVTHVVGMAVYEGHTRPSTEPMS